MKPDFVTKNVRVRHSAILICTHRQMNEMFHIVKSRQSSNFLVLEVLMFWFAVYLKTVKACYQITKIRSIFKNLNVFASSEVKEK